jgi:tetratricopeptide (TPR) repeat protein
VSKNRKVSLALAVVLSACAVVPPQALGNRVLHDPAPVVSETPAPPATTDAADGDSQQSKHKESGFVRALAAPFRALARLFGGGPKKSKADEAKKSEPRSASGDEAAQAGAKPAGDAAKQPDKDSAKRSDAPAAAASPGDAAKPESARTSEELARASEKTEAARAQEKSEAARPAEKAETKESPSAPVQEAGALSRGIVSGAQGEQQGARIVRPSDADAAAQTPGMWVPVIEGISKDPLTQGRALLEHGYVQEAIAELTVAAARVGPGLAEANNLLGLAYDRLGWHAMAAEAYQRALTAAPKDPNVLANLGYSLYLADDYEGALRRLKQAAKLAPGTPVIYNSLGVVEARLRRYDDAFKHLAAASNEYDAHLKLASILEDQKRDRDAIKHYEAALRIQPGTSAVLERLVALYERTGQHDKADEARRTLGRPKNPQKTTTGGGG